MQPSAARHPFSDLLTRIDSAGPVMEARLVEWAGLNSGSRNAIGLCAMAAKLVPALRGLDVAVEQIPLPGCAALALRARKRPAAPLQVLLSGHFDTVYGETDAFQTCTRVDDDTLRGPGVADMKGGLVVMFEALQALEASDAAQQIGWEILLTPDEETGSLASVDLLKESAERNHLGIVFECGLPEGRIISSRNGGGVVRVIAKGRAAHAGRDFAQGRNAVVALAHFISAAHFLNKAMPEVVVNAGTVSGGGTVNIVPEHAAAEFNIRARRAADSDEILRRMRDAAASIGAANEVSLEVSGGITRPPMEATTESMKLAGAWCAAARDLGHDFTHGHSGGGSDANILVAAGLPCIDGAGVEGGELHSDREWMRPSSLSRRAKIAALFLIRLAMGEIDVPVRKTK